MISADGRGSRDRQLRASALVTGDICGYGLPLGLDAVHVHAGQQVHPTSAALASGIQLYCTFRRAW
jgi:hypothetical protein